MKHCAIRLTCKEILPVFNSLENLFSLLHTQEVRGGRRQDRHFLRRRRRRPAPGNRGRQNHLNYFHIGYIISSKDIMRPRSKSTKPSQLSVAVTELRKQLGQTQQQFAQTLDVTITTIARYETSRSPSGAVLIRLRGLALALGEPAAHLEKIFFSALIDEFPWYRYEVAKKLTDITHRLLFGLLEAHDAAHSPALKKRLKELVTLGCEIELGIDLVDPLCARLPEDASMNDIARTLLPMRWEGQTGVPIPEAASLVNDVIQTLPGTERERQAALVAAVVHSIYPVKEQREAYLAQLGKPGRLEFLNRAIRLAAEQTVLDVDGESGSIGDGGTTTWLKPWPHDPASVLKAGARQPEIKELQTGLTRGSVRRKFAADHAKRIVQAAVAPLPTKQPKTPQQRKRE